MVFCAFYTNACSVFCCVALVDSCRQSKHTAVHVLLRQKIRVPTAPGKPGKMTTVFPVLEKSWNFKILLKILEKWE